MQSVPAFRPDEAALGDGPRRLMASRKSSPVQLRSVRERAPARPVANRRLELRSRCKPACSATAFFEGRQEIYQSRQGQERDRSYSRAHPEKSKCDDTTPPAALFRTILRLRRKICAQTCKT